MYGSLLVVVLDVCFTLPLYTTASRQLRLERGLIARAGAWRRQWSRRDCRAGLRGLAGQRDREMTKT